MACHIIATDASHVSCILDIIVAHMKMKKKTKRKQPHS